MIRKFLGSLFSSGENKIAPESRTEEATQLAPPVAKNENYEAEVVAPPKKRSGGYKSEVKERYGFELPASDTDKMMLGKSFEKEGELEKACACYEGCVRNRFSGNGPYDRLIILYKRLDRPDDVLRIMKKAISVFEKVVAQGRVDGPKKLEKYKAQLEKLNNQS